MKESVLLFHFQDKESVTEIRKLLLPLGISVLPIDRAQYHQPLGALAGIPEITPAAGSYRGKELSDKMLVFAGISNFKIDIILSGLIRQQIGPIPYKAVLTPTNQYWTPPICFEELKREHEAFTLGK